MSEEKKSRTIVYYIVAGLAIIVFAGLVYLGVTKGSDEDVEPVDSTAVCTFDSIIPADTLVVDSLNLDSAAVK